MLSRERMAFLSFAASAGIIALFGLIYLFSPTYLPHHEMAIGQPWEQIEHNTQVVILSMMRAIGSGWIALAFGIYFILFTAFKQGQPWARWAMFGMGMIVAVPVAFVGIKEQVTTDAVPPWILPVFCIIFFISGFFASKNMKPQPIPMMPMPATPGGMPPHPMMPPSHPMDHAPAAEANPESTGDDPKT